MEVFTILLYENHCFMYDFFVRETQVWYDNNRKILLGLKVMLSYEFPTFFAQVKPSLQRQVFHTPPKESLLK